MTFDIVFSLAIGYLILYFVVQVKDQIRARQNEQEVDEDVNVDITTCPHCGHSPRCKLIFDCQYWHRDE